jgi:hypothetical protein
MPRRTLRQGGTELSVQPKPCWQRPGLAWLERARFHLEQHSSEVLAADDGAAYRADVTSIKMLDVFAYLLQRDEQQRRRKKREELARLRELRNQDAALLKRLADTEEFELPLAA